jgi:hypothetical protein
VTAYHGNRWHRPDTGLFRQSRLLNSSQIRPKCQNVVTTGSGLPPALTPCSTVRTLAKAITSAFVLFLSRAPARPPLACWMTRGRRACDLHARRCPRSRRFRGRAGGRVRCHRVRNYLEPPSGLWNREPALWGQCNRGDHGLPPCPGAAWHPAAHLLQLANPSAACAVHSLWLVPPPDRDGSVAALACLAASACSSRSPCPLVLSRSLRLLQAG